ncbi:MAG: hypothetical protein M1826_001813 [Phylliscum demangeonii]|nr:MAG: hypothetical protein M1826_001813 [Phylliscum demangeonii]
MAALGRVVVLAGLTFLSQVAAQQPAPNAGGPPPDQAYDAAAAPFTPASLGQASGPGAISYSFAPQDPAYVLAAPNGGPAPPGLMSGGYMSTPDSASPDQGFDGGVAPPNLSIQDGMPAPTMSPTPDMLAQAEQQAPPPSLAPGSGAPAPGSGDATSNLAAGSPTADDNGLASQAKAYAALGPAGPGGTSNAPPTAQPAGSTIPEQVPSGPPPTAPNAGVPMPGANEMAQSAQPTWDHPARPQHRSMPPTCHWVGYRHSNKLLIKWDHPAGRRLRSKAPMRWDPKAHQ